MAGKGKGRKGLMASAAAPNGNQWDEDDDLDNEAEDFGGGFGGGFGGRFTGGYEIGGGMGRYARLDFRLVDRPRSFGGQHQKWKYWWSKLVN